MTKLSDNAPVNDDLPTFPELESWLPLMKLAILEDLGAEGVAGDVTSRLTIPDDVVGTAALVQKSPGVTCGLPAVGAICQLLDERLHVEWPDVPLGEGTFKEAASRHPEELLQITGPVRSILAAERLILNLLGHLGGIATFTRQFARRCDGTRARIYDTRKTRPGFRSLDKYAVRCGGGFNHRVGLHDMVLVKDNHLALAGVSKGKALAKAVQELVERSRAEDATRKIEIEVDTFEQFERVLDVEGVDVILLDNMDCPTMTRCVTIRDGSPGAARDVLLEASGGVTLATVRDIAATGVDRISVGAITHSAPALDVSLDVDAA
ncbi:MAG: carboxylating nicotinate-nucleotide diphosphorylase [Planctomycetota bacterium]